MNPRFVTAHLLSGDFPALVTQDNGAAGLNLAVFTNAEVIHRMNVQQYVPEADDTEDDRIGMWSE